MNDHKAVLKGVVHGKTIEFAEDLGVADGQEVNVTICATRGHGQSLSGDGILRSAGAWSDDPDGLDEFVEWNRQQRKIGRREIEPGSTVEDWLTP